MNTPVSLKSPPLFVLNPSKVKNSLEVLRHLGAHPTLAGYLCVQRTAAQQGKTTELRPLFKEFFKEFLVLGDAPDNRPYINPFVSADAKVWLNENVAGSYSPSSLREVSPLRQVLTISNGTYNLKPQHWLAAQHYLTANRQIPVLPLAVFMFRDRGIAHSEPTIAGLVRAFQQEFGYLDQAGNLTEAYKYLYADYTAQEDLAPQDWFIPFTEALPSE